MHVINCQLVLKRVDKEGLQVFLSEEDPWGGSTLSVASSCLSLSLSETQAIIMFGTVLLLVQFII